MPRYQIISVDRGVGAGVSDPVWASLSAVLKRNSDEDPYCVANELICGPLGQFLGLPVPPCALLTHPRNPTLTFFGTLNFNLHGDSVPPDFDVGACLAAYRELGNPPRPDHAIGTLLFDIWIANGDRHERNLALDTDVTPHQLHVFDHSWALFGRGLRGSERPPGIPRFNRLRRELGVSETSGASGNRHCLLDSVRTNERFGFWLSRIRQIPDYVLRDAVGRAYEIGQITSEEAGEAVLFLQFRRANLAGIINECRSQFTGVPDENWSQL